MSREEFMAKLRARATVYSEDYEFFTGIIDTIGLLEREIARLKAAAPEISASGNFPVRFYGPVCTAGPGIQVFSDPAVPEGTIEIRDSVDGRLLGRIINIG